MYPGRVPAEPGGSRAPATLDPADAGPGRAAARPSLPPVEAEPACRRGIPDPRIRDGRVPAAHRPRALRRRRSIPPISQVGSSATTKTSITSRNPSWYASVEAWAAITRPR